MKIHFVGIGGIGTSALAKYYLDKGHEVSGSDLVSSEITQTLKKKGAKIKIGEHKRENLINGVDKVVYTRAVEEKNPEIQEARNRNIEIQSYPEALGELTKKHFTIAIAGTHGKSTTASMISLILTKAGLDPTVILGTKIEEFGNSNCRVGESKYLVIEADEWKASFLNYDPNIITLTNIEREHLDYYKNLEHILKTYKKFIKKLSGSGFLIGNKDNENVRKVVNEVSLNSDRVKWFSIKEGLAKEIKKKLSVPGEHNVYNALGAFKTSRALKVEENNILSALSKFKGVWRRFEIKKGINKDKEIMVVTDYAHHPTEIKATLDAAHEKFPNKEIWVVFQPHQQKRTKFLFDDFVNFFKKAEAQKIIISDIYEVAGRDHKKKEISSKKIVKAIDRDNVIYAPGEAEILKFLNEHLQGNEVIMIMGAGNIYKLAEKLEH